MDNDWLYSNARLELRQQSLLTLLERLGGELDERGLPKYSSESIYGCAHDWVSQGNPGTHGIINYYKNYYI